MVIRVCDKITVNLMAKACGYDYAASEALVTPVIVDGIVIPFASPTLRWKTKQTFRERDKSITRFSASYSKIAESGR